MSLGMKTRCSVIFALTVAAAFAAPADKASEPANAGVSIWTQNVSGFRKEHGAVGGYKQRWDLSGLPHYLPKRQLTGTLRIAGNNYIKDGELGQYWREGFKRFQPGVTLEYFLPTAAIAVPALACGRADLGMSNKATLVDLLMFEQVFHHPISEVMVATGSYDVYGWAPATIFAVNKDNPLTQITFKQLDGVFGGARAGGYAGSVWHTEYPYSRGPAENIRTWGQLGLTGEWADKPIHVGGQNLKAGVTSVLNDKLLRGSGQFAEGYHAFSNYIMPDGKVNSWSQQARRSIAEDKYALYYLSPAALGPGWKELAVQSEKGGQFVKRSLETVHDRTYPFVMEENFYFNREPGQPLDPRIEEFLHYILSQEGQDCVQREGRYTPLTAEVVREQLKKLE
jgi:phosphate transport system substrate-binding protein